MNDAPNGGPDRGEEEARRRRRPWILAHHPDRGGEPDVFVVVLKRFSEHQSSSAPTDSRPTVYRSRSLWRRARRMVRNIRQTLGQQPRSRRLL